MCVIPLSPILYGTQLTNFNTGHLHPRNTYQPNHRLAHRVAATTSGFNARSTRVMRVWEHNRLSSHPDWYLFGRQPYIGTKHVAERCSHLLSKENNPVVFTTADFKYAFARPAKKSTGVREYLFLEGGRVQEVESGYLTFIDKGSVGHGEADRGVEPVAVHRCI